MGGSWQIELTRPWWLTGLAVLPVLVFYWRRTLVWLSPGRRIASLVLRTLLVLLVVAALCGPKLTGPSTRDQLALVWECCPGRSVALDETLSRLREGPQSTFEETFVQSVAPPGEPPHWSFGRREIVTPEYDIAAAVASARASVRAERVGRIVLLADGRRDPLRAMRAAEAAGVPIWTVPLRPPREEVYVAAVTARRQVRRGEPFYVDAIVQSTHADEGTLQVLRGGTVIATPPVRLTPGENRFQFPLVVNDGPAAVLTARISGCKDTIPENNEAGCVVLVGPPARVLVVESQRALAGHLEKALQAENIEVDVRPPQEMPATPQELRKYDLVILSNVPADLLPAERMEMLRGYVRHDGGGLVAVGGQQSMTAGGYHGTVLEDVLPVICAPKGPKPKPPLAMVLIVDVSGSMEGHSISLAKEAIRRAVGMLGPRDQVGVLAFEDESHWITPLGPVAERQKILAQVDTLVAGGGTTMYPAIERAYLALRESHADLKHILVVTDGMSNPGDFDAQAREVAAAGITMSTVGVGADPARPLLRGIAERAGGHAYFCDDAAALPRIFTVETSSALRFGITEEPFFPKVVHTTQALAGLDFSKVPTLLGYVETQPKPAAQVVLAAGAPSGPGEPILAVWRYGLGTVAAFTSDIQSRWAAAWLGWDGFGRFWTQLVRQTMRKDTLRNTQLDALFAGRRLSVAWDAVDPEGRFVNGAEATVKVLGPGGKQREARLEQVAPGRYAATLEAAEEGPYFLEGNLRYQGRLIAAERLGLVMSYSDELRTRPVNEKLLREIAERTGGRYDPTPEEALAPSGQTVPQTFWLWPWLLGAMLTGLVVDVRLKRRLRFRSEPAAKPQAVVAACLFAAVLAGGNLRAAEPLRPLDWGPAPPAAAVAEEGAGATGPTLAELAAAAAKPPATPLPKTPATVVQRERYPWAYRTILLRYFDWPPAGR
jgi:uncharacterized membrane protein